jgi:hypothetical protein
VWKIHKGRKHRSFKPLSTDLLNNLDRSVDEEKISDYRNCKKGHYLIQSE